MADCSFSGKIMRKTPRQVTLFPAVNSYTHTDSELCVCALPCTHMHRRTHRLIYMNVPAHKHIFNTNYIIKHMHVKNIVTNRHSHTETHTHLPRITKHDTHTGMLTHINTHALQLGIPICLWWRRSS